MPIKRDKLGRFSSAGGSAAASSSSMSKKKPTNSWAAEQQAGRARADKAKARAIATGKRVNVDSKTAYDPKLGWVDRKPRWRNAR